MSEESTALVALKSAKTEITERKKEVLKEKLITRLMELEEAERAIEDLRIDCIDMLKEEGLCQSDVDSAMKLIG